MSHLEQQLSKIEKEVSDDLTLFKNIPSNYYSIDSLKKLYIYWQLQLKYFNSYLRLSLIIGLSIPILVIVIIGALVFKQIMIAKLLFLLIPIITTVFLGLTFWIKYRFESSGELEQIGVEISNAIKNKVK